MCARPGGQNGGLKELLEVKFSQKKPSAYCGAETLRCPVWRPVDAADLQPRFCAASKPCDPTRTKGKKQETKEDSRKEDCL